MAQNSTNWFLVHMYRTLWLCSFEEVLNNKNNLGDSRAKWASGS